MDTTIGSFEGADEKVRDFDSRHGKSVYDKQRFLVLFEDGAARDVNARGFLFEPPQDKLKLLKNILRYWQIMHAKLAAGFNKIKNNSLLDADKLLSSGARNTRGGLSFDDQQVLSELEELQKKIKVCERNIEKLEEGIELLQEEHTPILLGDDGFITQQNIRLFIKETKEIEI